ncbi:putative ribonuclease H-like domain-containing protein [Tanacetum coccineum]|uniref:Ribonuclease H-like domain-containing protein n=1 Tax=Tanacetum coccineum TaxID=301880 RepID=A0ABQ4Y1Z4_9ASTR
MLTMRARTFLKKTGRKFFVSGNKTIGFDKSKVSTDSNCSSSCLENVKILKEQNEQLLKDLRTSKLNVISYKTCLESVEARLLVYKKNEAVYEEDIKLTIENFEDSSKSLSKLLDCQIVDKCKTGLEYNDVPPPYTGNFMPPKPDLLFSGLEEFMNEPIVSELTVKKPEVETSEAKASAHKPKVVRKNNGALNIEEWVSNSEDEDELMPKIEKKTVKPSFAKIEFIKSKEQVKSPRKTTVKQGSNFEMINKACYECGSFDHLHYDCDNHQRQFKNKEMGNPQMDLQDKGVIDSGCSRHVTGNMSYLTDFEEIDGGYAAFGGNIKGGKIKGKCTIKTGGLTCLFPKATSDESKLWHRRLGYINFKTINKLVKGNLVRGLPSKLFENNQTCVACQKEKKHRASCKSKIVSSISQPLHMLHMDLFGPTFVKSLMKKMYCLVVTDDYSRFSWVFFLATKDETSDILKSFITRVENIIDQKVKVIRCDNGTEFKNKELNQFCERKGIKREFSVARTPQQNRVAERKNRTLIKAAKTMLADSKLPTTFWAEVVNTACYVQNRFSENTTNIAGSGPNWLFDIDALTKSMNYKPIVARNQSNGNAGTKACDDIGDDDKKVDEGPRIDSKVIDQEKEDSVNSTNTVNAASTNKVNVVGAKTSIELPDDLNKPELEDIVYSDDDEDVGAEADMNNLDAFIPVSPIPTTRVYKDHPVEQIIRDLNSAPQTRRMTKNLKEHGLFSFVQQRTNHKDFQNCLFACFLSQEEPKKVIHALKDPSWIEAMQEKLLQFKLQEV